MTDNDIKNIVSIAYFFNKRGGTEIECRRGGDARKYLHGNNSLISTNCLTKDLKFYVVSL